MADQRLDKLGQIVRHHLSRIRSVYADPARVRLTLLIRDTEGPDGDALFTADDLDEVRAAIARLEAADAR